MTIDRKVQAPISRVDVFGGEVDGEPLRPRYFLPQLPLTEEGFRLAGLERGDEGVGLLPDPAPVLAPEFPGEGVQIQVIVVVKLWCFLPGPLDQFPVSRKIGQKFCRQGNKCLDDLEGRGRIYCRLGDGLALVPVGGDILLDDLLCDNMGLAFRLLREEFDDLGIGPAIVGLLDLGADEDLHGIPELPGYLHHRHEAGIHTEDVNLLADGGAGAGKDLFQFPVVQGVAAGGVVIADATVSGMSGGVRVVAEKRNAGTGSAGFDIRRIGGHCPAPGLFPPTAAVVPEDQEIPLGGVSFHGPAEEIIQNLRIAGVRLPKGLQAVPVIPTALGDPEAPGLLILQAVKLDQDVDILRGSRLGHLLNISEGRPIEIVVPVHIDHDRPFGLVARCFSCLFHHHAPFQPRHGGVKF